jgi:hypothetical protein
MSWVEARPNGPGGSNEKKKNMVGRTFFFRLVEWAEGQRPRESARPRA